jgi:hypothetical protein
MVVDKNWQQEVLAVNREDAQKIAKQFQFAWTRDVLLKTGMDGLEDCFPEEDDPDEMTLEQKIKLRSILDLNKMLVLDDRDGGVKIYLDREVIGEWMKPTFSLHEDLSQIDPRKKLYSCINIKYWSYFDEEFDETHDDDDY